MLRLVKSQQQHAVKEKAVSQWTWMDAAIYCAAAGILGGAALGFFSLFLTALYIIRD